MPSANEPRESRRRTGKYLALMGGAGIGALVAGITLGVISYDKKYFPEGDDLAARLRGETIEPSAVWEAVSLIGFLLTLGGVLAIVASVIGLVIVGAVRVVRRAAR